VVRSVASLISWVDTEVDARLDQLGTPEAAALKGSAAVAEGIDFGDVTEHLEREGPGEVREKLERAGRDRRGRAGPPAGPLRLITAPAGMTGVRSRPSCTLSAQSQRMAPQAAQMPVS
jgi:hypothetical protein